MPPNYGAKIQYAEEEDTSQVLGKDEKKIIQQVTGTFSYYSQAVDGTMQTTLSAIAAQQAAPTMQTMEKVKQFLDYCATNDDAVITYKKSKMVLTVHSDAGYLNKPHARSRAGENFSYQMTPNFSPTTAPSST